MANHQKFFVTGTTCRSCEVVIERELLRTEGIEMAKVSHKKRTLEIETDGRTFHHHDLTSILHKHGYRVKKKDGEKTRVSTPVNWQRLGGMLIVIFAAYGLLSKTGLLSFTPSSAEPAGLLAVFVIGVIASLSSCTAVVGGLVVAIASSVAKEREKFTAFEKFRPHLYFNVGRIAGFAGFGALIGLVGSAVQTSGTLNGVLVLGVAVAMVIIGINLLELFPVPVVGMPKWLAHWIHDLSESPDPKAPMFLGAMTFFLPCGFTQSMQLFALSLESPTQAALVMSAFAIGTMPALLGVGGLTSVSKGKTLKRITAVAGVLVMVLGISNSLNGLALLGIDPTIAFAKPNAAAVATVINGKQHLQMEVLEYGRYAPDVLTVQEAVPVEWSIHGADFMGCGNTLILPAFGVNTYLKPGYNTVNFTPTKSGRFVYSCSMGMIRGTMIVTPSES